MQSREYEDLFRKLMNEYCMDDTHITYVENVAEWCRKEGFEEPDSSRPFRLVSIRGEGCRMVVRSHIPREDVRDRIKALSMRGALINVASDRAERLDSEKKQLGYLFLSEYASTLPDLEDDELLADNWVFDEMKRLGLFRE